jgi:hypothetical protein
MGGAITLSSRCGHCVWVALVPSKKTVGADRAGGLHPHVTKMKMLPLLGVHVHAGPSRPSTWLQQSCLWSWSVKICPVTRFFCSLFAALDTFRSTHSWITGFWWLCFRIRKNKMIMFWGFYCSCPSIPNVLKYKGYKFSQQPIFSMFDRA